MQGSRIKISYSVKERGKLASGNNHGTFRPQSLHRHNSMACHITSNWDFDKGDCVIWVQGTKTLCDNCQPRL